MPNAIPPASVRVFLGENSYPDGHTIGGMFKLVSESIGQPRSAGGDQDTYSIKFGIFIRFGIVFVDRDRTNILVVSGSREDELEIDSRWVGHDSEDAGER